MFFIQPPVLFYRFVIAAINRLSPSRPVAWAVCFFLLAWQLLAGSGAFAQKINPIYHYDLDCSGCTTQILVEISATDLRNRINRSTLTVEVVFRGMIYSYDEIYFGQMGDVGYATFNIRLTTKGQKIFIVKLIDASRHGNRQDVDSQAFKMDIVPIRRTLDTAIDPCVACQVLDDSLAKLAGFTSKFLPALTTNGFFVRMKRLEMVTKRGKLIKSGYDKYYLHVVSTYKDRDLEIGVRLLNIKSADSIPGIDKKQVEASPYGPIVYFPVMKNRGENKWYVAVISSQRKFKPEPRRLRSKALFVRAIEYDKKDSAYLRLKAYAAYVHQYRDSLYKRLKRGEEKNALKQGPFMLLMEEADRKVREADYYYETYKLFENIMTGKEKRAARQAQKAANKKAAEAKAAAAIDTTKMSPAQLEKYKQKAEKKAAKEAEAAKKPKKVKDEKKARTKPKRFLKFFTSNFFLDKSLKFSVFSHPYGLPHLGKVKEKAK